MNCKCGRIYIKKRKTGPLKGFFVCPACGRVVGPRPLVEAARRNIPVELWSAIHRAKLDAGPQANHLNIEMTMIEEWRNGNRSPATS